MLSVLDRKWREHLYEMDYLKEGIGLRAMAQRDPLVEYQREGFDMFAAMLDSLKEESVGFLYNLQVQVVAGDQAAGCLEPPPRPRARPIRSARTRSRYPAGNGQPRPRRRPSAASGRWRRCPRSSRPRPPPPARPPRRRRPRPPCAAKGLGGPNGGSSGSLTYSGPREDGGTETSGAGANRRQGSATATTSKAPGRNEPCPCGSGKKYKLCHGRPGAAPL